MLETEAVISGLCLSPRSSGLIARSEIADSFMLKFKTVSHILAEILRRQVL